MSAENKTDKLILEMLHSKPAPNEQDKCYVAYWEMKERERRERADKLTKGWDTEYKKLINWFVSLAEEKKKRQRDLLLGKLRADGF